MLFGFMYCQQLAFLSLSLPKCRPNLAKRFGSPPLLWRIGDEDEPSSLIRLSSLMRRTFSARSEHLLRPRSAAIEVVEMLQ
ncbi:hypothetical protein GL279_03010 [Paracoccus limosus]|uniref:Uncharacterized protein n=1 Tax=Paracoccus limosus TaxID=913252 RepID=A0A844H0L7_9RHOB|nr:hypothetical protein [Paracoccus limosus]